MTTEQQGDPLQHLTDDDVQGFTQKLAQWAQSLTPTEQALLAEVVRRATSDPAAAADAGAGAGEGDTSGFIDTLTAPTGPFGPSGILLSSFTPQLFRSGRPR